jgi:hypothetical protein
MTESHEVAVPTSASATNRVAGAAVPAHLPAAAPPQEATSTTLVDSPYYSIGNGPRGRGLFAKCRIPPRTLVHVAPGLRVTRAEYEQHMRHTLLEHYLFNTRGGDKMLALGYGSLFNHANRPNVDYRVHVEGLEISYTTGHAPIAAHEELTISYGANLWFANTADGAGSTSSSDDEDEAGGMVGFLGRMQLGDDEDDDEELAAGTIQKK